MVNIALLEAMTPNCVLQVIIAQQQKKSIYAVLDISVVLAQFVPSVKQIILFFF